MFPSPPHTHYCAVHSWDLGGAFDDRGDDLADGAIDGERHDPATRWIPTQGNQEAALAVQSGSTCEGVTRLW